MLALLLISAGLRQNKGGVEAEVRFARDEPGQWRAQPATSTLRLNLNRATIAEIELLPGVGRSRARRIVEWRARNGSFKALDELAEIRGLTKAFIERIEPLISLEP